MNEDVTHKGKNEIIGILCGDKFHFNVARM
jgi:hypothetical protein